MRSSAGPNPSNFASRVRAGDRGNNEPVLTMTEEAADAVRKIINQPEVPSGSVLRFTAGEDRSNGAGPYRELHVELVEEPPADDVQVEELPISLEPASIEFLDDKVLDASIEGNAVEFKLYRQAA